MNFGNNHSTGQKLCNEMVQICVPIDQMYVIIVE